MKAKSLIIAAALAIGIAISPSAVQRASTEAPSRYIVTYHPHQSDRAQEALETAGAEVVHQLDIVRAFAVEATPSEIDDLVRSPAIERVRPDARVEKTDFFTVDRSGAAVAWDDYGLTGEGVTVAVVDSGVHNHKDFESSDGDSRILQSVMFAGPTSNRDFVGHGTHVAGIVAGNGQAVDGHAPIYGVAPEANLVSVGVLDKNGVGLESDVIAGLQWIEDNKDAYDIGVAVLSLGKPITESYTADPLTLAVESLWDAGVVVVVAAGNGGRAHAWDPNEPENRGFGTAYGSILSPGNSPYVITVGATTAGPDRSQDRIATYSSRGPSRGDLVLKPDLVAPGNGIVSLTASRSLLEREHGRTNDFRVDGKRSKDYFVLSGTSMAAPVVAGAAALLLESDPSLSPDDVKARLMATADVFADGHGDNDPLSYGAGYLNIPAALESDYRVDPGFRAESPGLHLEADGQLTLDITRFIWGERAAPEPEFRFIWGTRFIWGERSGVFRLCAPFMRDMETRFIWGEWSPNVDLTSIALEGDR